MAHWPRDRVDLVALSPQAVHERAPQGWFTDVRHDRAKVNEAVRLRDDLRCARFPVEGQADLPGRAVWSFSCPVLAPKIFRFPVW